MSNAKILCTLSAAIKSASRESPVFIPRSVEGDRGDYYLLESAQGEDVIQILHKHIGVDVTGYTKTEIDCKKRLMREIGYSEISPDAIENSPGKWFELVPGSSKSDLFNFVCNCD